MRVMKKVLFFYKTGTNAKSYCPEGFYQINQDFDGHNGANLF